MNQFWAIDKIDQVLHDKLPFKNNKGLSSFLKHEKID